MAFPFDTNQNVAFQNRHEGLKGRTVRRLNDVMPTVRLTIYAVICCTLAAAFVCGLYWLMQPARIGNPGLAAYKPAPGTVINYPSSAWVPPQPDAVLTALEPDPETIETPAPQNQVEAKNINPDVKAENKKSRRPAPRKEQREPKRDYAFQPFFGGWPWH